MGSDDISVTTVVVIVALGDAGCKVEESDVKRASIVSIYI